MSGEAHNGIDTDAVGYVIILGQLPSLEIAHSLLGVTSVSLFRQIPRRTMKGGGGTVYDFVFGIGWSWR